MLKKRNYKQVANIFFVSGILLVFIFFRLWKINKFQYWSDDEQLLWYTIRHIIVDKHPSLVVVNTALGISLGSVFHVFISPWYFITKMNPQLILLLGNLFSLTSIVAIYKAGKLLSGKKTAFIASFLYSASFISSLFDRRLWALTPNFLVTTLSLIALLGLNSGKKKYIYLLLPAFILPFNSDPSLLIALISSIIIIALFKIKLNSKHFIIFNIFLLIFLSPLIFFEIRHKGQNFKSIVNLITIKSPETKIKTNSLFLIDQLEYFSKFIYSRPSKTSEIYFCYCAIEDDKNLLPTIVSTVVVIFFIYKTVKTRDEKGIILVVFLMTYFSGVYIFKTILSRNSEFFYTIVISPVIFLILAKFLSQKSKPIITITLLIYIALNLNSLLNSEVKYTLNEKLKLTEKVAKRIGPDEDFSLYYGGDIFLAGGGWTSLFSYNGTTPIQGSLVKYWGHAYKSYDLYPREYSLSDPATVVTISEKIDNAYATIIDNRKKSFNPVIDVEKLYIPKYFY